MTESPTDRQTDYRSVVAYFNGGEFEQMRQAAQALLELAPGHGKGWKMLALACLHLNDPVAALPALDMACDLLPEDPEVWDYRGVAFNLLNRHAEASAAFSRSVALDPLRAESWVNFGKSEADLGRYQQAIAAYDRAVAVKPDLVDAHNNRSIALFELGALSEAVAAAEAACALAPTLAWPRIHLGNALQAQGRIEDAVAAFRRARELAPELANAWSSLGLALRDAGENDAAISTCEHAWRLAPYDPQVLNHLGTLYAEAERRVEARRLLQVAVELRPDFAEAWLNLGRVLLQPAEKVAAYRRGLELRPDLEFAQSKLVFLLNDLPDVSPTELLEAARDYGAMLARRIEPRREWTNRPDPLKPLRVGMVSADLRVPPVAYSLEAVLLAARDKGIEWFAYSAAAMEDETTARLKASYDVWHDIHALDDEAVAAQVTADGIDILIDLSGHTAGHRLPIFAAKPAPVQVTWLGYVGTTGLSSIDYIIGDPHTLPPDQASWTVEAPWRLPECYMSFARPEVAAEVVDPPLLKNGFVTFGSFSSLSRLSNEVLDLWAQVLLAVPRSRLVLRVEAESELQEHVLSRLMGHGVDRTRLDVGGRRATRELDLAEYDLIDIALDPFPCSGASTSAEALWMGVPVLTLRGDRPAARVAESLDRNLGLQDWIARDKAEYVSLAASHAGNPEQLVFLRRTMRDRGAASPLGNPEWFANQFIRVLRDMWKAWCRGGSSPRSM